MSKPHVFISYCHEDIDRDVLNMLVNSLEKDGQVEVISDRLARCGDDIDEFMGLLKLCEVVIVICTPEYKKRIDNREKSVYFEYKTIIETHEDLNSSFRSNHKISARNGEIDPIAYYKENFRDTRFSVLPIHLSGKLNDSVPEFFQNKLAIDLVGMMTTRWKSTGELRPQKNFRNSFDNFVELIIATGKGVREIRDKDYQRTSGEIFKKLFIDLKHDAVDFNKSKNMSVSDVFVKTLEFHRVLKQHSYIFVGRKGSGKSTLTDYLTRGPSDTWKIPILYNVDGLNLELLYSIIAYAPYKSDYDRILTKPEIMRYAWESLLHFLCFEVWHKEYAEGGMQSFQRTKFEKIKDFYNNLLEDDNFEEGLFYLEDLSTSQMSRLNSMFSYSLSVAITFVDEIIRSGPSDQNKFDLYLAKNLTTEGFLVRLYGKDFLAIFYEILSDCDRKFFIAIDGFDYHFQKFRKTTLSNYSQTDEYVPRMNFEIDWLSGLVNSVRRCKRREGNAPLSGAVDFCITVPKDRYLEMLSMDRDAYEFEGARMDIRWTAIELSILLRKRLELYCRTPTDKSQRPLVRLRNIIGEKYDQVPSHIDLKLAKRREPLELFQYVLRHSFWRPRDVLLIWATILSAAEHYKQKEIEFNEDTVKLLVSRSLDTIIELEFLKEFEDQFPNLEEFIKNFSGADQVMSIEKFNAVISKNTKLNTWMNGQQKIDDPTVVMELLYRIGFLGFELLSKRGSFQKKFDTTWVFNFNEGDSILKMIKLNDEGVRIVIHPVFIEWLSLKPFNGGIVMGFNDDYLNRQEAREASEMK